MMESIDDGLKAAVRVYEGSYLHLSLDQLRINLQSLVNMRHLYFAKLPDQVDWETISPDGSRTGRETVDKAAELVGKCDAQTSIFRIRLFPLNKTRNVGFELPPDEYVYMLVNFDRKRIVVNIKVASNDHAQAMFRTALMGIDLFSGDLPPEHRYLEPFIRKLFEDHSPFERNVFLAMRFQDEAPFPVIIEAIRTTCKAHGLNVLRADDKTYTDDLWDNVMTYMYGCASAIAVFDRIHYQEFNPNIALEIGFLFAQRKRVLLLKDRDIPQLPSDVVGKIYRPFNTYAAAETIPPQIEKWVRDVGLGVPPPTR